MRVHVVRGAAFADVAMQRRAEALLDDGERARALRFVRDANRVEHVLAWALVRSALAAATGLDPRGLVFRRDARGRPHLVAPDAPAFSLTHTDGLVACAVTRGAVGLDAERADRAPSILEVASHAFSARERAWLAAASGGDRRGTRAVALWTTKEAYLKALGLGLVGDLTGTTLEPGDAGAGKVAAPAPEDAEATPYDLRWWTVGEHVVALATPEQARPRIELHDGAAPF